MEARGKGCLTLSDILFIGALCIVAVLIPVLVGWLHFGDSGAVGRSPSQLTFAILVTLMAMLLVGFNLYTSFLRPWMYRRAHGDYTGYQYVSGAPALGSILIAIAAFFLPSASWIGGALLTLYLMDPGGIHVAAFAMLRECFTDTGKNA